MPRARLQREPCDCLDCREGGPPPPGNVAAAVARQDPHPPKSLVLCITDALQPGHSSKEADLPHLHTLVRTGWAGLLACRSSGPPLPLQLLGLPAAGVVPMQSLPDRFKQLRAVLLTDSEEIAQAGRLAGCYAVHHVASPAGSGRSWQSPAQLAARICRLLQVKPWAPADALAAAAPTLPALAAVLGAAAAGQADRGEHAAEEEQDDVIDMLLVVLDAAHVSSNTEGNSSDLVSGQSGSDPNSDTNSSSSMEVLEWADSLLSQLNQVPGFRETVLLSLVLGQGQVPLSQEPVLQQWQALLLADGQQGCDMDTAAEGAAAATAAERLQVRRPLQSYQFAGQDRVDVDALRPAVVVQRLAGVIRVDTASSLDLADIQACGAAGCILAERLLPEVAYKLGRAPKYGA